MREFNFFEPYLSISTKKDVEKTSDTFWTVSVLVSFIVAVGIIGFTAFHVIQYSSLKKDVEALDRVLEDPAIKKQMERLHQVEDEVRTLEAERQFVDIVDKSFHDINKVNGMFIDFVANEVVDNLYLTNVEIREENVSLQGLALNRVSIAQFEYDLRKNGNFDRILVESIEKKEDSDYYQFRMNLVREERVSDEN